MKTKFFLAATLLLLSVNLCAQTSGKCGDNLTWTLDSNGTLTISGTGKMTNYDDSYDSPWYSSRNSIKKIIINSGVTSIGDYAFIYCSSVTSVTIPNSVTSIGDGSFHGCSSLTSVTIPNSVTSIGGDAFLGCSSLTSVTIPNSVTSIGDAAFRGCSSLTSITIPNSVKDIGSWAFMYCRSITSVSIPSSVTNIGQSAFGSCSSLTSIEVATDNPSYCSVEGVLFNKEKNTIMQFPAGKEDQSYSIPATVNTIYDRAFVGCSNLIDIMIPTSITKIGQCAFGSCAFTTIIIPYSVTNIGMSAFWNCGSLTSVTIPNSVTSIAICAFRGCRGLTSVTIPNSVTSIGDGAFLGCSGLTSLTIPNSVTSIGYEAFRGCSGLSSVVIGNRITGINNSVFIGCVGLVSVSIGNGVKIIQNELFKDCSELETISLGKSVKEIGAQAFSGCKRITDIYCYAERVPDAASGSNDSFKDVSRKAYLWVPANRLRNYQTDTFWGEFDVRAMEAESANTDQVIVKPENNTAEIIWPASGSAETYELTIKDRNGNEICTLVFNAQGQLQSIAFKAPAAEGSRVPEATEGTGFRFTVTGLDEGTQYDYTIVVKDIADNTIETYTGSFRTKGGETGFGSEVLISDGTVAPCKVFHDGQVLILMPDGKKYDMRGTEVR